VINIRDILAKIAPNGHPTGSAKLSETIADLERQHGEALKLIATADERANALLLANEDKKLDALEVEVRIAHRDVDKIEAALPGLRERLSQAIAHEKKEAAAKYLAEAKTIAKEIAPIIDKLFELNKRAFVNFTAASRELGEGVARMAIPDVAYHGMINAEGLEVWKRIVGDELIARSKPVLLPTVAQKPRAAVPAANHGDRVTDSRGDVLIIIGPEGYKNAEFDRWPAGAAVYVMPGWAERLVEANRAKFATSVKGLSPIYPAGGKPTAKATPARAPLPPVVPIGFLRVTVLRAGYPDQDGRQCDRGTNIDLPEDIAGEAALNGAIEIIRGGASP
jgi:hypothetical protein